MAHEFTIGTRRIGRLPASPTEECSAGRITTSFGSSGLLQGRGDGASIFRDGHARTPGCRRCVTRRLRTVPFTICFSFDLGGGGEANAGRAEYAALLHHGFYFI